MSDRKKSEIEVAGAHDIKVGDQIWVYGHWLAVTKTQHLNRHPIQLREFYFAEFREPIRVPDGWKIERRKHGG